MNERVDVMIMLFDSFDFDPDNHSPFLQKCRSREEFVEKHIGYSQFKLDTSPRLNDNENDRVSTTRKEEKLKNAVLVYQMKHLADKFNSTNFDKDEEFKKSMRE